ncbi:OsmC family protein [Nitratireductor sp. ZSWI3]|uniref:OsmC family protein n=1 Tax=Nitratireductor sp. ZSWI3 TaxID=2966359 RepID=UPI00214F6CC4|nr:OsmC family protein [Nitratireductor sp. ZSWI3]MCR4266633.1 OsmC family protein [Nitratireductor sp. ZSWI3]
MAEYRATIEWALDGSAEDFLKGHYSRGHDVRFSEHVVPATASHHVVGKWAAPGAVDPEEMLVASISNCHMLTFLHVARLAGFVVTRYRDTAMGVMEKNGEGRMAVTCVTLRPEIAYRGRQPTGAESERLHRQAHEQCFIANSVTTDINVEEGGLPAA